MIKGILAYYGIFSPGLLPVSPINEMYRLVETGDFNMVIILGFSFICDIILVLIGKVFFNNLGKKNISRNLFINSIIFRFFPIISHIGSFRSGYSNYSLISIGIYFILGYILVYGLSTLLFLFSEYFYLYLKIEGSVEVVGLYFGLMPLIIGFLLMIVHFLGKLLKK